jgi:hypothetical protein
MKKIAHLFYRTVTHLSNPVTDVNTNKKEIVTHVELLGFVIKRITTNRLNF